MSLKNLIHQVRDRLEEGAYQNEAAVSVGIVLPILAELGWDVANPSQIVPEFPIPNGRVDFALFANVRQPRVFVEVKGVGRLGTGDKQLFEYAFHEGVPICLLTDGREWSFYYPPGEGDYSERRVQKLDLLERQPDEVSTALFRYLDRERVRTGVARDAVDTDFRDLRSRRDAERSIPEAWNKLVGEPEDLLIELLQDQTESISGVRPTSSAVHFFLQTLKEHSEENRAIRQRKPANLLSSDKVRQEDEVASNNRVAERSISSRTVAYQLFGEHREAKSGNAALVEILREITKRYPTEIEKIALRARGRSRNHIARTPGEIYPKRPDLARAEEICAGWLVGLNIANREKLRIIQAACEVVGLDFGVDVAVDLPNADNKP